jgi:fatty acid desaturase
LKKLTNFDDFKFHSLFLRVQGYFCSNDKVFYWDELIILTLPAAMFLFGSHPLTLSGLATVYGTWGFVVIPAEFMFALIFINRGHHGTEQAHQNDELKSLDFGEFQIATTLNRKEANRNTFLSLSFFGDQVLHHLFPTLDGSILPQLRETLEKTCKEFDIKLPKETTILKASFEQFKQLFRSNAMRYA